MEMKRSELQSLLKNADGYAIPMFVHNDVWDMLAICEAADELNAIVMFASLPISVNEIGLNVLGAMGKEAVSNTRVPIIHHLDHCNEVEMCCAAIDNHYPSVMIDASHHDLETNIEMVKQVCDYAHPRQAIVEAELGRIKGRDYEGTYEGDDFLTNVDEAVELVKRTNVDSLAVGIGTAHGFYKGKPELNFERLSELNEALDVPLVLHGGTGIPVEDIRKAIGLGIKKVNIGTHIRTTHMKSAARIITERGYTTHTIEIMHEVKEEIKQVAKEWIKICMADNKS